MKLLRTVTLMVFAVSGFSLHSDPALADLESKGTQQCNQAGPSATCIVVSMNAKTPDTDAEEAAYRLTPVTLKTRASQADVSVSYRYSGPTGNGRTWALDNGSTMATGDKFKVFVEFNQAACVYLMQFDSHGQSNELMKLSEQANCQAAGTRVILPAENMSFTLDQNQGQETIHTIVSQDQITGLEKQYQDQISRITQGVVAQYHQSKGILKTMDPVAPGQPRSVVCPGTDACRDEFVIQHVAKR